MKQTLHVDVTNYDIEISDESFSELMKSVYAFTSHQKRLYVVSRKVYKLYKNELHLYGDELLLLPDGEPGKNIKNYLKIINTAIKRRFTRKDVFIAVGGGVIGDITGFAASTYMRGIDYIQIPTTLLSMVDSSVGGKTAIDFGNVKNVIGTFYQPKKVYINTNFLNTLDKRQFMSGLGEILKYAFIENNCNIDNPIFLFEYLSLCCEKIYKLDFVTLIRIIEYCLRLKIAVVNNDEKEASLRKILNFGHTLGHALETITKFKKYTHGEAVVYGLFFAFKLAQDMDLISDSYYRLSIELLEKYGFKPLNLEKFEYSKIIEILLHDKKVSDDNLVFILPCGKKLVKEEKLSPHDLKKYFKQA